ncbi:Calmodulin [Tubulinosema ratisbonensis]|uniref:Calmodulin n=1 Tax=Tubulinosema ratisbonensis TaxID=291195 RepID=A0A437AJ74_9MICR|nr:Calmodulin [Tubulinosema ratisbonensis]
MTNYQNIFNLYADSSNNTVRKTDLEKMLLYVGHTISPSELAEIPSEEITFEEFKAIVNKTTKKDLSFEVLKEAFESYDPEQTGYISFKDIKAIYCQKRENLDDEEEDELMNAFVPDKNGKVNYMALLKDYFEEREEH